PSRSSAPSSTSWRTIVATKVFITLPMWKQRSGVMRSPVSRFATPAAASKVPAGPTATSTTPGSPQSTTASSCSPRSVADTSRPGLRLGRVPTQRCDRRRAVVDSELGEDVLEVPAHRPPRQAEPGRDLGIRPPHGDLVEDLLLAGGQVRRAAAFFQHQRVLDA